MKKRNRCSAILTVKERMIASSPTFCKQSPWAASHEQVRDAGQRLAELGLVLVERVEAILVARLTERGEANALGSATCEGVLRATLVTALDGLADAEEFVRRYSRTCAAATLIMYGSE